MYEEHNFYCISCGQRSYSLQRNRGFLKKGMHRKKLYCPHCKEVINHIECKNDEEAEIFKENYYNGMYINEAIESMEYVKSFT